MVARTFAVVCFIAAGYTAAAAGDLSGHYTVITKFADGRTYYSITAVIKMTSENTCDISYSDGTKGVCILDNTTLSVGSVIENGKPQVGVYQVAPDGSIEGVFYDRVNGSGLSHEKLTPVR